MKVFDILKSKNIDDLADWLDKYMIFDNSPWVHWWDKTYCKKCEPIDAYVPYFNKVMECAWCEVHKKCRFFEDVDDIPDEKEIIKMWLNSEAEE